MYWVLERGAARFKTCAKVEGNGLGYRFECTQERFEADLRWGVLVANNDGCLSFRAVPTLQFQTVANYADIRRGAIGSPTNSLLVFHYLRTV